MSTNWADFPEIFSLHPHQPESAEWESGRDGELNGSGFQLPENRVIYLALNDNSTIQNEVEHSELNSSVGDRIGA